MTGYRVAKRCSWKQHAFAPGGKPLVGLELIAAGLPAAVIEVWVGNGAFVPVDLPDPPPKVESPKGSAVQSPKGSRVET